MSWQTLHTNLGSIVVGKKKEDGDDDMFGQSAIVQIVSKVKGERPT